MKSFDCLSLLQKQIGKLQFQFIYYTNVNKSKVILLVLPDRSMNRSDVKYP